MKKEIFIHPNASAEFEGLNREVQKDFRIIFGVLEDKGELREPLGKKLKDYE